MTEKSEETQESKGGSSMRKAIVLGAVLVTEAVLIVAALRFLGAPTEVAAGAADGELVMEEGELIVEIPVFDGKLSNDRSGIPYVYDTEVYVQVKKKQEGRVTDELERFQNEIKAEISAIWRSSEPYHFQEPKHETLTRRVQALLGTRFGNDADTDEPIITKCIVVMGTGFRIDG